MVCQPGVLRILPLTQVLKCQVLESSVEHEALQLCLCRMVSQAVAHNEASPRQLSSLLQAAVKVAATALHALRSLDVSADLLQCLIVQAVN